MEALEAGQSIRRAAYALGLDRNKVARLRQRAIAEGRRRERGGWPASHDLGA